MLRGRLHSSKRCFYGTKWCQWTKGKGPLLDMWRYVWKKSPIILRLSFWMILDSKTCLCQMSDHEKSLIIHEQCLWNRPFCQVITNWQCSAFLLLFLSIWSFSDQFSHQIITGSSDYCTCSNVQSFSHLLITSSTPDQCLIISWSMFDHRSINAWSMLFQCLIIAWSSDCCCHCRAQSRCGSSPPNGLWKEILSAVS